MQSFQFQFGFDIDTNYMGMHAEFYGGCLSKEDENEDEDDYTLMLVVTSLLSSGLIVGVIM